MLPWYFFLHSQGYLSDLLDIHTVNIETAIPYVQIYNEQPGYPFEWSDDHTQDIVGQYVQIYDARQSIFGT